MSDQKHPFHEVIASKLITASARMGGDVRDVNTVEVLVLLHVLQESKMPAIAAHEIAEDNVGLPKLLAKNDGGKRLAEFATEVLNDLHDRED